MIPGSALRRLEAITGLTASAVLSDGKSVIGFRLNVGENAAYFVWDKDEKKACNELRELNLRRVNNLVFENQGWKCRECGLRKPLQGHHVRFRSRWRRQDGPLDVESNLVGMCGDCHSDEHR